METDNTLTDEEKAQLGAFLLEAKEGEFAQVHDLLMNCNSRFQFASTHSKYVKDWETTKRRMEENLNKGALPPGISANFQRALIDGLDVLMEMKLEQTRTAFEMKFNESIYNYLGKDGKKKGFLSSIFG